MYYRVFYFWTYLTIFNWILAVLKISVGISKNILGISLHKLAVANLLWFYKIGGLGCDKVVLIQSCHGQWHWHN